jgi:hypothetical protein
MEPLAPTHALILRYASTGVDRPCNPARRGAALDLSGSGPMPGRERGSATKDSMRHVKDDVVDLPPRPLQGRYGGVYPGDELAAAFALATVRGGLIPRESGVRYRGGL